MKDVCQCCRSAKCVRQSLTFWMWSNPVEKRNTMKKFIKIYWSLINKKDLVTALTASVIITAGVVACGGRKITIPLTGPGDELSHIATSPHPGSHIFPGSSKHPFVAAMFDIAPTPSELQQSYDAVCNFPPGFLG